MVRSLDALADDVQIQRPLKWARTFQPILVAGVSVAAGFFLAQSFDLGSAVETAAFVPPPALVSACLALASGLLLSCVRYHRVLDALGLRIPFRLAFRANLLGIIGGLLFFQLLGQTLARTAVLSRSGAGGSAVLLANVYERITALFSLTVLAVGAALYLYGSISIDLAGGGAGLFKLAVALAMVGAATFFVACRRLVRFAFSSLLRGGAFLALARVSLYSLLMHLSTLAAFVALGRVMAPGVAIADFVAASLIVMFAASVPISFAGWGVREISAVYAYGMLGISPDKALAISILVGLLSLALVFVLGWLSYANLSKTSVVTTPVAEPPTVVRSGQIERSLSWFIPLLAAALVFFQVHLPTNSGALNVNLADPIAIGGGFVFLARYLALSDRVSVWRLGQFEVMLLAATVAIIFALVNGWARFGYSDWAFYNRFIGWFVLLGYVGTGALIAGASPSAGLKVFLKCILAAGIAITLLELAIFLGITTGLPWRKLLLHDQLAGMAQNANAFALQLTILIAIFCVLPDNAKSTQSRAHELKDLLILAAMMITIFYAGSRTGYVASVAVLFVALALKWVKSRLVFSAAAATILVLGLRELALTHWMAGSSRWVGASLALLPNLAAAHGFSNLERWYSITRGLELWTAHPLFGNGLGAFITTVKGETGATLVIHNTTVWLLAEMGVVGLAVFSTAFAGAVMASWRAARQGELWARTLILVLLALVLFQMTHDVFYQRIFWLIAGATLFTGRWQNMRRVVDRGGTAHPRRVPARVP